MANKDNNSKVTYFKEENNDRIYYTHYLYDEENKLIQEVILQINKENKHACFSITDYLYYENHVLLKESFLDEENQKHDIERIIKYKDLNN